MAFDPWNSSSAGHQRADGGSGAGTPWREWRNTKLGVQYGGKGGKGSGVAGGGAVGPGERTAGVSVVDMLVRPGVMRGVVSGDGETKREGGGGGGKPMERRKEGEDGERETEREGEGGGKREEAKKMFEGLVIYVNGNTHPLTSDHRLKQVLAENGARMSLHLGRRRVTHVILGRPGSLGAGSGGGLAGGKLEREIKRVGGCGVKYVGVEW